MSSDGIVRKCRNCGKDLVAPPLYDRGFGLFLYRHRDGWLRCNLGYYKLDGLGQLP